jgi:tetratricopeptide (TPR) repeat protein
MKCRFLISAFACCSLLASPVPSFAQTKAPAKANPPADKKTVSEQQRLALLFSDANTALEKKDYRLAAELFEKYISAQPGDAAAHVQLGYAYVRMARNEDARKAFERAIELEPKLVQAHWNLGLLLLDSEPKSAIGPLLKATLLDPKKSGYHAILASAYQRIGNPEAAMHHFRAALELDPADSESRARLARLLLGTGKVKEAEAEFREVLRARANDAYAKLGLSESLIAQKRFAEAEPYLAAYLEQKPDDHASREQHASLLLDLEKFEAAVAEIARLEESGALSENASAMRVEALVALKRYDEAVRFLQQFVERYPKNAEAQARLGRLLMQQRDFPAAERALRAALTLDANQTEALRDLSAVYVLSERYAEALAAQDLLAKRETPGAGFWFYRAICFDKLRKKPEALEAYQRFLELEPNKESDHAFQARQRIKIISQELKRK